MTSYQTDNAPHIRAGKTSAQHAWSKVLALIPALIAWTFADPLAIMKITGTAVSAAILTEVIAKKARGHQPKINDGSSVLIGMIFALMCPTHTPAIIVMLSVAFAVYFAKELFGGIGETPFQPNLVAYLFMYVCFSGPLSLFSDKEIKGFMFPEMTWVGLIPAALLALGGLWLLFSRIIRWEIPVFYTGIFLLLSPLLGHGNYIEANLVMVLFFSFFVLTDHSSTPMTRAGLKEYALLGAGLATWLHAWGAGMAVICALFIMMNALSPWIDAGLKPKGAVKRV